MARAPATTATVLAERAWVGSRRASSCALTFAHTSFSFRLALAATFPDKSTLELAVPLSGFVSLCCTPPDALVSVLTLEAAAWPPDQPLPSVECGFIPGAEERQRRTLACLILSPAAAAAARAAVFGHVPWSGLFELLSPEAVLESVARRFLRDTAPATECSAPPGALLLRDGVFALAVGSLEAAAPLLASFEPSAQPRRVALVRAPFHPEAAATVPLAALLRPLGHGVVALATCVVQQPAQACWVEEWLLPGGAAEATLLHGPDGDVQPLPNYLHALGLQLRLSPDPRTCPAALNGARQSAHRLLAIAPAAFDSNTAAAQDNAFMAPAVQGTAARDLLRATVLREHAGLVAALQAAGVTVRVFSHGAAHNTPDAVFPNNWFSLSRGVLALYPMKCRNRSAERRPELISWLAAQPGARRRVDWTAAERATPPAALEGTGSLVIDHLQGIAYLARSERSDVTLAAEAAHTLGLRCHSFDACDASGRPIYHTNVVLSVGSGFAVVCEEAVAESERVALLASLRSGGREVVTITRAQMGSMCGNVLEVRGAGGLPLLALSTRAHDAFTAPQRETLLRHVARLVHAPLDTLEEVGGGSCRCCLGELFD